MTVYTPSARSTSKIQGPKYMFPETCEPSRIHLLGGILSKIQPSEPMFLKTCERDFMSLPGMTSSDGLKAHVSEFMCA